MKQLAVVGVVSVALLGLALLWSARMLEDVSAPPLDAAPARVPAPPADDAPRARLAPAANGPAPAAAVVPSPSADVAPPAPPSEPPPDAPPPEPTAAAARPLVAEADEPFGEDSKELEYAFRLATDPDATDDQVRNAAEVFERCLKNQPGDDRCYRGLVTAQTRLGPAAGLLTPSRRGDGFVPRPRYRERSPSKPSPLK